jgi:hypothetical protein
MSDRDAFRANRNAAKAKLHEKRLENATYTAAEVKVLTETASKVAYELGRKDAGEALDVLRQFVAVVDGPQNESYAVRCAVMWHAVRDIASQPPQAASDAISGVPRHSEVSEAPKAPQEPCDDPECPVPLLHTHTWLTKGDT